MQNEDPHQARQIARQINLAIPALLTMALTSAQAPVGSPEAAEASKEFKALLCDLGETVERGDWITFALARLSAQMIQQLCDLVGMDPNEVIQHFALTYNSSMDDGLGEGGKG